MRALFFLVAALSVLFLATPARAAYAPPERTGFVTDPAKKLTPDQAAAISSKLSEYRACSTNEVAVFLPTSLEGNTIQDVAYAAFNTWKLGLAAKDNGVLLVIAPAERTAFIATGKGVGGEIPDISAFHILRDHVTPNMKVDKVFAAVDEGTSAIGKELGGCAMNAATPSPPAMSAGAKGVARVLFGIGIFFVAFALFTGLRSRTLPKLIFSSLVTAVFEAATFRWDPIAVGFAFSAPLFAAMMVAWARRNPRGVGGDASSYDAGGSSGGGSSGGSSSGGSTGGGGASDSW